jgi:Replication-relaxation
MSPSNHAVSAERLAILRWIAGIGAATAEALAQREGLTVASARGRLVAAEREGLLASKRPLVAQPTLYTITRAGVRASRTMGTQPCRVSNANAQHLIVCAEVAAELERCYPDYRVVGERDLRWRERERGAPLASARLGSGPDGHPLLHRPDLVLWPRAPDAGLPVAVEVELAVKAPRRLAAICGAWARCREVAGVLYLAAPEAKRAVLRAIEQADAASQIVVVPLAALPREHLGARV